MTRPTIVIDESVSMTQFSRFERFARQNGLDTSDRIFIHETHPSIPDGLILQHYLSDTTVLVTTDRPFHNQVLTRGLRSYYLDEEVITNKPLPGIQPQPDLTPTKDDLSLKENYQLPVLAIRPLLLPASPTQLKKLRIKRRRIRNHFGGQDHLDQVAVTVSWHPLGTQTLIGLRVRISSNVGLKALDASESYLLETIESDRRGLVALCHALILLIQLRLHPVKTLIYYDTHRIDDPPVGTAVETEASYQAFFDTLLDCFEDLEFGPAPKGKYVEKLRRKLKQLVHTAWTNEIVPGNIAEIIAKVGQRDESPAHE